MSSTMPAALAASAAALTVSTALSATATVSSGIAESLTVSISPSFTTSVPSSLIWAAASSESLPSCAPSSCLASISFSILELSTSAVAWARFFLHSQVPRGNPAGPMRLLVSL